MDFAITNGKLSLVQHALLLYDPLSKISVSSQKNQWKESVSLYQRKALTKENGRIKRRVDGVK
jgi:hypothetical protein